MSRLKVNSTDRSLVGTLAVPTRIAENLLARIKARHTAASSVLAGHAFVSPD
ncbi:hypothetical protein Plhal304r1_c056g0141571 [Plasmopara halstedii]